MAVCDVMYEVVEVFLTVLIDGQRNMAGMII